MYDSNITLLVSCCECVTYKRQLLFLSAQEGSAGTMTGPVLTDTSRKIEPNPDCYAYDPQKFHHEPSIVTYFPNGRLGNVISAYVTLSWIQMDHKLHTYIERGAADVLSQVC